MWRFFKGVAWQYRVVGSFPVRRAATLGSPRKADLAVDTFTESLYLRTPLIRLCGKVLQEGNELTTLYHTYCN